MGSKTLFVKPAEDDMIVRDPLSGRYLPPAVYTEVEANSYWRRRVRDGSVLEEPPAPPEAREGREGRDARAGADVRKSSPKKAEE